MPARIVTDRWVSSVYDFYNVYQFTKRDTSILSGIRPSMARLRPNIETAVF